MQKVVKLLQVDYRHMLKENLLQLQVISHTQKEMEQVRLEICHTQKEMIQMLKEIIPMLKDMELRPLGKVHTLKVLILLLTDLVLMLKDIIHMHTDRILIQKEQVLKLYHNLQLVEIHYSMNHLRITN
jgi:hypothetical protein